MSVPSVENRRYYRLVRDIMRAIDWLKPLRNAKVVRARKVTRRSRCEGMQLAGELLEARQLLSGVNEGGLHAGDVPVQVEETFYLPPQHWLNGNGALLSGPAVGTPLEIATNYLQGHANELGSMPRNSVRSLRLRNTPTRATGRLTFICGRRLRGSKYSMPI